MNYHGETLSSNTDSNEVYQFLKKAMGLIEAKSPFRGPEFYQEGDWIYNDKNEGTIDDFEGVESIYFRKEKVYELKYFGGKI